MEEKPRIILWAVIGFPLSVLMTTILIGAVGAYSPDWVYILAWSLFIAALVLLGMALTTFLRILHGRRAAQASILTALGLTLVLLLVIVISNHDKRVSDLGMTWWWSIMVLIVFAFFLMSLWEVLLYGQLKGFFSRSARIEVAFINLVLSVITVNVLRWSGIWPDGEGWIILLALILAFAMVSTVMSLSDLYIAPQGMRGEEHWILPILSAFLFGLLAPLLGMIWIILYSLPGFGATM